MSAAQKRGWPIRGQIIALIAITQILSAGLTLFLVLGILGGGMSPPRAVALEVTAPFTTALAALQGLDEAGRARALAAIMARDERFSRVPSVTFLPEEELWPPGRFYLDAVRDTLELGEGEPLGIVRSELVLSFPMSISNYGVATRLSGGDWLVFTPSTTTPARLFPVFVLTLILVLLALPILAFMVWATGTLVAPLKRLAQAAERFSQDLETGTAPEDGPAEVRTAARAFNAMRARLKALIDTKSYTLAAISHDLRTPLTRMRLRLEGVGPADEAALLRDIHAMEVMVDSALSFIRDGDTALTLQQVDLAALAQTVSDDIADLGHAVAFSGPARLPLRIDPTLIRRALTNIIENAITYGTDVAVTLTRGTDGASGTAILRVADNGPGIAAADYEAAFEPFWRGDAARGRARDTGFGLGLSIARTIVERHGGTIALQPNAPNGLVVEIVLPVTPVTAA